MAGTNQIKISELPTKKNPSTNDYLVMDDRSETSKIKAKDFINSFYPDFINLFYPVGSIYMSVNDIEPSVLFGGTWEKIKDRFLLASGDTYAAGDMDGEAKHTLTANEIPNLGKFLALNWNNQVQHHTGVFSNGGFKTLDRTMPTGDQCGESWINAKGGEQPHNNMPPYLVVNIWQRIS